MKNVYKLKLVVILNLEKSYFCRFLLTVKNRLILFFVVRESCENKSESFKEFLIFSGQ
jgi:hypothetical protein